MKTKSMTIRTSKYRSPLGLVFLFTPLALVCFVLSPAVRAVTPAPDGGYPGSNTGEGQDALFHLTNGVSNTAIGAQAIYSDTTTSSNTAVGAFVMALHSSGNQNVTVGQGALADNSGLGNVAVGFKALRGGGEPDGPLNIENSVNFNQSLGYEALFYQTGGQYNNGFGWRALFNNITGSSNTALGHRAGYNITGNGNVCIGAGVEGFANENNTTRIRNIATTPLNTGMMVLVDSNSKLGHVVSSRRYKEETEPMDKASEALFVLKPVTFRYKGVIDPVHVKMFGLIAEEVAEVNPDLVVRNAKGEVDTIRFDSINAMLLNEFLKEQRNLQGMALIVAQQKRDFEATIAQREKKIKSLIAVLRDQTSQLQELSAWLEASDPETQVVNNP
jgi:hypothetical protein